MPLKGLCVTDWKYRECLARLEKSKILKLCLKNALRELLSKTLFRSSKNLNSSTNSQKNENTAFCLLNMQKNTWKIDKVRGSRIKTICKTSTRGKLSIRALPLFYLTIGSFKIFKHFEGFCRLSKNCHFKPLWKQQKMRSFTGLKTHLGISDMEPNTYCAKLCRFYYNNTINSGQSRFNR